MMTTLAVCCCVQAQRRDSLKNLQRRWTRMVIRLKLTRCIHAHMRLHRLPYGKFLHVLKAMAPSEYSEYVYDAQ